MAAKRVEINVLLAFSLLLGQQAMLPHADNHLGKAPEFRGSSPGFYELLAGVPQVGVTVHRVDDGLDSGPILLQRTFPLDPAPTGDPIQYLAALQREGYWSEPISYKSIRAQLRDLITKAT